MEEKFMQDKENPEETQKTKLGKADIHAEQESGARPVDVEEPETEQLRNQLNELKDKYLRQAADFDNFRKRTAKEKLEFIQTAGRDVISSLLTVLDDCDRAEEQLKNKGELSAATEGTLLIFNKLRSVLQSKGLRPMKSIGTDFNPEFHEAITEVPAPSPDLLGKVVDEVECGYYLNDKIIRFAKVVVGK